MFVPVKYTLSTAWNVCCSGQIPAEQVQLVGQIWLAGGDLQCTEGWA